jgi:hypothetical protein
MKWLNVMASLALMAGPSLAQREPSSILGPETDPLIIKVRDQLKNSDDTANLVSERISRSKLITLLTPAVDHEGRKAAAKEWIEHDPTAAARVAVGLMRDDQTGTTLYEDSFIHQTTLVFEHNPGSEKNLFNRLNKLAQSSKLIKKQSEELSEDEKMRFSKLYTKVVRDRTLRFIPAKKEILTKPLGQRRHRLTEFMTAWALEMCAVIPLNSCRFKAHSMQDAHPESPLWSKPERSITKPSFSRLTPWLMISSIWMSASNARCGAGSSIGPIDL